MLKRISTVSTNTDLFWEEIPTGVLLKDKISALSERRSTYRHRQSIMHHFSYAHSQMLDMPVENTSKSSFGFVITAVTCQERPLQTTLLAFPCTPKEGNFVAQSMIIKACSGVILLRISSFATSWCTALKMWAFHRSILSIALLMSCSSSSFSSWYLKIKIKTLMVSFCYQRCNYNFLTF